MGSTCCGGHDTEGEDQNPLIPRETAMTTQQAKDKTGKHPSNEPVITFNIQPLFEPKLSQDSTIICDNDIKSPNPCDGNNSDFTKCSSAYSIKWLLHKYHTIIDDINENALHNQTNILVNECYSNEVHVKLMNDFYHIKYNHNINDDTNQFDAFHEYLTDNKSSLKCNMHNCKSVERYNRNRNKLLSIQLENDRNDSNDIKDQYCLFLMSRIHTFFIHSYETAILTKDELKYIEEQLNELKQQDDDMLNDKKQDMLDDKRLALITDIFHQKKQKAILTNIPLSNLKYITSDHQSLNYGKIAGILNKNGFNVQKEAIERAFENFGYYKHQLMNDLCEIFNRSGDDEIILSQILKQELHFQKFNQRQKIYELLLTEYTNIEDLNKNNFMKILKKIIAEKFPDNTMNISDIETICREENLNGRIFVQQSTVYRNSLKFGLLFKSIPGWNRKIFARVYVIMKKRQWMRFLAQLSHEKQSDVINLQLPMYNLKESSDEESDEEVEEKENLMSPKESETDEDKLQLFCAITRAERNVAAPFLKDTNWNVVFAVRKYYGLNGEISKLDGEYGEEKTGKKDEMFYNDGIQFWYWDEQKDGKQYIKPKTEGLKSEILNINNFTSQQWDVLQQECQILMQTNQIKQIKANGRNANIYGIKQGAAFTIEHLYALKLYTDHTWLCKRFCEAFRLMKLTTNTYERIKSLRKRNKKVANWARLLIECVQTYGNVMSKKRKYYRGIDMEFMFKKFVTRFHVPLSTTIDFTKAAEFADGTNGLVIELKRYNTDVRCFNSSIVSSFDAEKETLFFDDKTILQIATVFQWWNRTWSSYRGYIDAIQRILKIIDGSWVFDKCTNAIQDLIGLMLNNDANNVPPYVRKLLEYHIKQLPNKIEYNYSQLIDNSTVKHLFVKKKTNTLNIANLCNLFKHCDNICIAMPVQYFKENGAGFQSLFEDLRNVKNKNVSVEFEWKTQKEFSESQLLFQQHSKEFIANKLKMRWIGCSVIVSKCAQVLQTVSQEKILLQLEKKSQVKQEGELHMALQIHLKELPFILNASFLKVYSLFMEQFMDVAAVLTRDKLYFISAVKYQIWEQFRDRSKIEQLINDDKKNVNKKIDKKTAIQLAQNLNIIDDEKINHSIVIPYLMSKMKNELKTNILLGADSISTLSQLFEVENNMKNVNCIKYIEIKDFYGTDGIPEEKRNEFMEHLLENISWIDEERLNNSTVVELTDYISQSKVALLNEKSKQYFESNQLLVKHVIAISPFMKNKIKYLHNELTCFPLNSCNIVEPTDQYQHGFIIKTDMSSVEIKCQANSNNERYEWITYLECLINSKLQQPTQQLEDEEKHTETQEQNEVTFKKFKFGPCLDYWQGGMEYSVLPKYDSLKLELLNNNHAKLAPKDYFTLYEKCTKLMKRKRYILLARDVGNINNIYNIKKGTPITINHLISLKLYTDYNKTGSILRIHCRKYSDAESMQDFLKRNSEIAHWCRYMKESCIIYGTSMSKKKPLYTGLKDKLLFSSLCQNFECSLSTTKHLSIAEDFADDHGMILELKPGNNRTRYFDVSWLSHFKWEGERIVMGSLLIIEDILINNVSEKKYIAALVMLQQIVDGQFIDRNDKTEMYLYDLIAFVLDLDDKPAQAPSEYIIALFQYMLQKIVNRKKIWINKQELALINHKKLKEFFVGFFKDENKNISKLGFIQQFQWTINGKEYDELMNLKPRKYIPSEQFTYEMDGKSQIKFHLQCWRQYSDSIKKCVLYLHIDNLPSNIAVQTSCDVVCEKKSKSRHLSSQLISMESPMHEILTFSTKSLNKQSSITWKLGMKIDNITTLSNSKNESKKDMINEDAKYEQKDDYVTRLESLDSYSASQIIFLLRNCIFPQMNENKVRNISHSIISYIEKNNVNGKGLIQMNAEQFTKAVSNYNKIQNMDESFKTVHQNVCQYDLSKIRVFSFGKSVPKTELANVMKLDSQ